MKRLQLLSSCGEVEEGILYGGGEGYFIYRGICKVNSGDVELVVTKC